MKKGPSIPEHWITGALWLTLPSAFVQTVKLPLTASVNTIHGRMIQVHDAKGIYVMGVRSDSALTKKRADFICNYVAFHYREHLDG